MSYENRWEALADDAAEAREAREERAILEVSDSCEEFFALLEPSKMLRRRAVVCKCGCNSNSPGLMSVSECIKCWEGI